jgi:hypothetical protein
VIAGQIRPCTFGATSAMPASNDRQTRRPWQFSMKTLILLPVYSIILMVGILPFFLGGEARGIGSKNIALQFVVLDSATSSPIPGATVGLYDADEGLILQSAETSTLGKARLTREFRFYFHGGTLIRKAQALVIFENLCFEVSAEGYKPARHWLSQFSGRTHDLELSKPVPVVVVKIDRIDESPGPGEALAP